MKKELLELMVYALAAAMSTMLFFFGLFYPSYTYTEETYTVLAPIVDGEGKIIDRENFEKLSQQEKIKLFYELDPSQIQYESKIWECIQNLKEEN